MKKIVFLLTTLLVLFVSCDKERNPRIEYKVNCSSTCIVDYSMNGGLVVTESVSGSWSKSFIGNLGSQMYLRVTLNAPNGNFSGRVLINGDDYDVITSNIPFESKTISGIIPE